VPDVPRENGNGEDLGEEEPGTEPFRPGEAGVTAAMAATPDAGETAGPIDTEIEAADGGDVDEIDLYGETNRVTGATEADVEEALAAAPLEDEDAEGPEA
jgi:hypothetical protein